MYWIESSSAAAFIDSANALTGSVTRQYKTQKQVCGRVFYDIEAADRIQWEVDVALDRCSGDKFSKQVRLINRQTE